jgi:hypothetical protein
LSEVNYMDSESDNGGGSTGKWSKLEPGLQKGLVRLRTKTTEFSFLATEGYKISACDYLICDMK